MTLLIPKRFQHLTLSKKIQYKGTNLKTVYLLHLIHHFIFNYTFDKDELKLSSKLLQKIIGMTYLRYIEYLVDNCFIEKSRNYSTDHGTANKYKLIEKIEEVVVYNSTDFVFNKKIRRRNDEKIKKVKNVKSPIPKEIRRKLIEDLSAVSIDDQSALNYIETEVMDNRRRYIKNLINIMKIKDEDIYWKFDKHGRFHSNFTNIKREVRDKYLQIDGEPVRKLDIRSSQPFFLAQVLKKDWLINDNEEVKRFINIVETMDIYKYFFEKYPASFKDRDAVKPMMFKCLFDPRKYVKKNKELFRKEFPFILEYIENYKVNNGEHLWKTLQRMESYFLFNMVYPAIIGRFKDIKLFTVHDSIHFPSKYFSDIKVIWDKNLAAVTS